jgi:putative OPT family oligopeptide transporter
MPTPGDQGSFMSEREDEFRAQPDVKLPQRDLRLEDGEAVEPNKPYVPDNVQMPEFTLRAVLIGAVLGIIFGASSLYLLLKVGMTVSASVPIAVLSITLFRALSRAFGLRRGTILENNIVQTAGSAGESIAFGVGVTMPALLLLGFDMDPIRVMTVSVLGGVLGILMMIPLRRAFIVKQHGKLKYPEGTACAEVLVAGEKGGSSATMVFLGFGIAFVYKWCSSALKLWATEPAQNLYGAKGGLKGAALSGELSPELMGVGFLIGPRIACMMMAGAVLSFLVLGPLIVTFGENLNQPVAPAETNVDKETGEDKGLIRNMGPGDIYKNYLKYIGAGAVAAGGIISMCRALPLIIGSIASGLRDLRATRAAGNGSAGRTERDLPISVVIFGSIALVIALAAVPQLGLGISLEGVLGALMILLFGFLFVTVSSRLTGEVGSSSNPISGMTIATLLLTCSIFVLVGKTASKGDVTVFLTSLSIAGVVCIASSNGGTTSQDLKTGFLVGATPKYQQYAILAGTISSAIVIGLTMLALNSAYTHYTKKGDWVDAKVDVPRLLADEKLSEAPTQKVGKPYSDDDGTYRRIYIREGQAQYTFEGKEQNIPPGWYLVDDKDRLAYQIDVPIKRDHDEMDFGGKAPERFKAPQPELFATIIKGILGGQLQWALVIGGALIAVTMELMGISALPVAVGMYLGMGTALPIFFGGIVRWLTDRLRGVSASEAETETSPGVLLASGYIAGGTLCGLLIGFLAMPMDGKIVNDILNIGAARFGKEFGEGEANAAKIIAVALFALLAVILLTIGTRKTSEMGAEQSEPPA